MSDLIFFSISAIFPVNQKENTQNGSVAVTGPIKVATTLGLKVKGGISKVGFDSKGILKTIMEES